jgi:hypothetical protein
MSLRARSVCTKASVPLLALYAVYGVGCSEEQVKYEPRPAVSGARASLPAVPNATQKPVKNGDAYTVWGASYYLRSRVHRKEVNGKKISLNGYIVKTNLPEAPECAVHRTGKADPENCKPPIPAFWIGDAKDAPLSDSIKVMGWASNYAQIYDAIEDYRNLKPDEQPKKLTQDELWGVQIPYPLPAKDAKVTVSGDYSTTFTKSSTGAEANPIMGLLTLDKITYLEPPPERATLPGMHK